MRLFVSQIQRSSAHNHAGGLGGSAHVVIKVVQTFEKTESLTRNLYYCK